MFKNYCKIAWRNLVQNRTFSLINLVGLSISVAFCLLLFFDIRWEQSYDQFHSKSDRLFRVESSKLFKEEKKPSKSMFSFLTKGDDVDYGLVQSLIVGRDMKQAFPEVKSMTRFQNTGDMLVRADKTIFKEKDVVYADPSFFYEFLVSVCCG